MYYGKFVLFTSIIMLLINIILYIHFYLYLGVEIEGKEVVLLGVINTNCHEDGFSSSDNILTFHSDEYEELLVYYTRSTPNLQLGFATNLNCSNISLMNSLMEKDTNDQIALVTFTTPNPDQAVFTETRYFICTKAEGGDWIVADYEHFGFYVYEPLFTPLTSFIIVVLAYSLSSLMSGLNIGLLALDPNELALLKKAGTARERKYAGKILPVRRCGNYLLCSILITATLCNAISTVITDEYCPAWIAIPLTTTVIVLLCEILPQSICTSYPLFVGANTIYITRVVMLLTAPISYPLGKILDWLVGKESLLVTYNKERLQELLKLTQLDSHEAKIIAGTLNLCLKTVEEIMTMSNDVFKLPITAVLDFETIVQILSSGYSRIPIYVKNSSDIRYVLLTKDLALLDPADKVPVKLLIKSKLKIHYIPKGTTVDKLFEILKDSRYHMVFVVDDRGSQEEDINVIGLVTFEDVLEEIFQMEINDETDKYSDNRNRKKLRSENYIVSILIKPSRASKPSENLKLAIFNFLSDVDIFSVTSLSPKVLRALLNLDIYYSAPGEKLPQDIIYVQGVPVDYFVMILEGEMEVKIGNENLTFAAGAFRYFGIEALSLKGASTFIPDYMLHAVKKSTYIKMEKVIYDAAILATKYERFNISPDINLYSDLYTYYKQLID